MAGNINDVSIMLYKQHKRENIYLSLCSDKCVLGAGGSTWSDDRGVPSCAAEPQLECPESCALLKGETNTQLVK